jgi:hypothetical protein
VRRGVTVGGVAAALASCAETAQALPATLAHEMVRHAELFLLGSRIIGVPHISRITSLAQEELNRLFLARLSTTVGMAALAVALAFGALPASKMVGLSSAARATTIFFDDFSDGSLVDGQPVSWQGELGGSIEIQDQSLIVSGQSVPVAVPSVGLLSNVSIRTSGRLLQGEAVGVAGRWSLDQAVTNYYAYVGHFLVDGVAINRAGISLGGVLQRLSFTELDFDPRQEDFNLQLDIFGNEIRYWAWPANEPRPDVPLGSATDDKLTSGEVFVWAASEGLAGATTGRGAFRYVHVATTSIPKTSTFALGSLGAVVLVSCALRTQLVRVRRP